MTQLQNNETARGLRFQNSHMAVRWHKLAGDEQELITCADFKVRAALVGRVGLIELSCGTGAWRVRDAMNTVANVLGMKLSADIGLTTIEYTCFDPEGLYSAELSIKSTGVNTDKLTSMEKFVDWFAQAAGAAPEDMAKAPVPTVGEVHSRLDDIEHMKGNYTAFQAGLAAGVACAAFTFLLGGGWVEIVGALFGAGVGNYVRRKMLDRHLTLVFCLMCGVSAACLTYLGVFSLLQYLLHLSSAHEAGYIGSMLFVIPGFPLITSGLDLAKQDMRSGLERLGHALMIIIVSTMVGWLVAYYVKLAPQDFVPLKLTAEQLFLLRLPASFFGVFGFSVMFNSPVPMAATAGLIGMFTNTLRLELVDLCGMPGAAAAFMNALMSGLIASGIHRKLHWPRTALTVPSIVIMVPGLYMYRAVYNLGIGAFTEGGTWLTKAILMVICMPMGLIVARVCTDSRFRHCD